MNLNRFFLILLPVLFCAHGVLAQEWKEAMAAASRRIAKEAQTGGLQPRLQQGVRRLTAVEKAFRRFALPAITAGEGEWETAWAVRSNQLAVAESIWRERAKRAFLKNASAWREQIQFAPSQDAAVWADMIPASARLVFVGEVHYHGMHEQMVRLVTEYRRLHPRRQIIFLTEFALDVYPAFVFARRDLGRDYTSLWDALKAARIPVAGLEEADCAALYEGFPEGTFIRAGNAGLSARNAHWIKRIKQWRAKYPDAVFFVYTGNGHIDGEHITALPWAFKEGERFTVSFSYERRFGAEGFFHQWTRREAYRPGVLKWTDRAAARAAGFDMEIILPK